MKKLYYENMAIPNNEETNTYFLNSANVEREAKDQLDQDTFKSWIIDFHALIRDILDLPNKIFAFATNNDDTKACIVIFPKEPNGEYYETHIDKESGKPYILIDEE